MARKKNDALYSSTRARLVETGLVLFRARSFESVGINVILREAGVPKGSFYHYFSNKDDFGLAVASAYHAQQIQSAEKIFGQPKLSPFKRLNAFFSSALSDYEGREFADGCLMCNLSTELGDQNVQFQELLAQQWQELAAIIELNIDIDCLRQVGLDHLNASDAANQLLNMWAGALTRMKADRCNKPLKLFMKSFFERER